MPSFAEYEGNIFSVNSLVGLIGDVVASREATDRAALHRALDRALDRVNHDFEPVTPLRITVGDEYQGGFASAGPAIRATLRLRLLLAPYDVRHGLGRGEATVLSETPRVEDGSAWWQARAAIEHVKEQQSRAATRSVRTWFAGEPAVCAALLTRDELLARLDERDLSVLAGMLGDMSQEEIARSLDVSASAVSQRVRRNGLAAIVNADALLGEVS